ncbi:unnamed protein product, partial [Prorocentrum cordatum]
LCLRRLLRLLLVLLFALLLLLLLLQTRAPSSGSCQQQKNGPRQPPRRGRPHHGLFATERGSPDAAGSSLGSSSAQELLEGCGGAQIALSAALAASRKADVRQEPPCTEPRRAARADRFARGAELRGLWSRDRFLLRAGLAKRPNSAGRRPGGRRRRRPAPRRRRRRATRPSCGTCARPRRFCSGEAAAAGHERPARGRGLGPLARRQRLGARHRRGTPANVRYRWHLADCEP